MNLNTYHYTNNKQIYFFTFLILFSFFIRLPMIFMFGDLDLQNEWKILVDNLVFNKVLSYRVFEDIFVPNLWMPPLYVFYLYFFKIFNLSDSQYILTILFSQAFLASISVVLFYEINKLFFSKKMSIFGTILFSVFPLHVYACSQISSISLQSFLTVLFIYCFFKITKKIKFKTICLFSLISGLLILLRGEFLLITFLSFLYLHIFYKINIKKILLIICLTILVISPYLIRNIISLNTISITKTYGYNLWKGNNPNSGISGSEIIDNTNLQNAKDNISKNKFYEKNLDKIFLNEAINNIKNEPIKYLNLSIKKFFSYIFIDISSSYPNYYNPFHYLPVLIIGIMSIFGIVLSLKKKYPINFLIVYFFVYVCIFSIFFILPRYKLAILPFQIIFSNILIQEILKKFNLKNE